MARFAELLEGCSAVVLSDYAKGSLAHAGALIEAARAAGVPVLVDPKSTDFGTYRGAGLLTPNRAEFEAAVGGAGESPEEMAARAQRACSRLDIGGMVVYAGRTGIAGGAGRRTCPAYPGPGAGGL